MDKYQIKYETPKEYEMKLAAGSMKLCEFCQERFATTMEVYDGVALYFCEEC